ncbi:hypothetical protein [Methanorbis furvi]|uniref:Uncharacterized protein n=1 Tax=Methanorbis furvi TaxID=3028299 RepID=A0AAE4MD86_9EURY|nr:hypothetical protein [Methanocorpusculaceae archaeon Ag1]
MISDEVFCREMQKIHAEIAAISINRVTGKDLLMQFPENPEIMTIEPKTTIVAYNTTINRVLMYFCSNVPDGVVVRVYKDNQLWTWKQDDSGSLEFFGGVYFREVRIEVENKTDYPLRWSINAIWV